MEDLGLARELTVLYDLHCEAIDDPDPEWLEGEIAALLAKVRLEEAKWWKYQTTTTWHMKTCGCEECKRIAALEQQLSGKEPGA